MDGRGKQEKAFLPKRGVCPPRLGRKGRGFSRAASSGVSPEPTTSECGQARKEKQGPGIPNPGPKKPGEPDCRPGPPEGRPRRDMGPPKGETPGRCRGPSKGETPEGGRRAKGETPPENREAKPRAHFRGAPGDIFGAEFDRPEMGAPAEYGGEPPGPNDPREPEGADPGGEPTVSRSIVGPIRPTAKMIEDHNVAHIPFRSWCPACVRGRAKSVGHRRSESHGEDTIPVVSIDYGFLGKEGEEALEEGCP